MKDSVIRSLGAAAAFLVLVGSATASATILAECGASKGKAFYLQDGRWTDDTVNGGTFIFTVEGAAPNLLFKDAYGKTIDAKEDGGSIQFSSLSPELAAFGIIVAYPPKGVVETYNVIMGADGSRRLFWTVNRTTASGAPKVAAFVADCQ